MALRKQVLDFAFDGSVSENVDPRMLPDARLTGLRNGVIDDRGVIKKRKGWEALDMAVKDVTTPDVQNIMRIADLHGEQVLLDHKAVYGRNDAHTAWVKKNEHASALMRRIPVVRDPERKVQSADCLYLNGLLFVALAMLDGRVLLEVIDAATRAVVHPEDLCSPGSDDCVNVRVVAVNDYAVILWFNDTDQEIQRVYVDSTDSTLTVSTVGTVVTAGRLGSNAFDAAGIGGAGDLFAVAYYNPAGPNVSMLTQTLAGATVDTDGSATWGGDTGHLAIALDMAAGGDFLLAYYDRQAANNADVIHVRYTSALNPVGNVTVKAGFDCLDNAARVVVREYSATQVLVAWEEHLLTAVARRSVTHWRWVDETPAALGVEHTWPGVHLFTRPWMYESEMHLAVVGECDRANIFNDPPVLLAHAYNVPADGCYVARVSSSTGNIGGEPRVIGVCGLDEAVGIRAVPGFSRIRQVSADENGSKFFFECAMAIQHPGDRFISEPTLVASEIVSADFDAIEQHQAATFVDRLELAGGCPGGYDGGKALEHLSLCPPRPVYQEQSYSGTGGLTGTASYSWVVTVDWYDRAGLRHISAPSPALPVTLGDDGLGNNNDTIELWFKQPLLNHFDAFPITSDPLRRPRMQLWRTKANAPDVYYFVNSVELEPFATDYVSFTDDASDDEIADAEQLYTTGGELPNSGLPSCHLKAVHSDRAWAASSEFPGRIYYTKPRRAGRPSEWSKDFHYLDVSDGGEVTGLGASDLPVVFKRERIFVIEGDGPSVTGVGGVFRARAVSANIGCTQPLSVVTTPTGVLFRSQRTFYLLDRGFQLKAVGDAIKTTAAQFPLVRAALMVPELNLVKFLCTNVESWRWLNYNWLREEWGVDLVNIPGDVPRCAAMSDGVPMMAIQGTLYQQGGYSDNSRHYPLVIETPWYKFDAVQAFKRVRRAMLLLRYQGAHALRVSVGYNESTSYSAVFDFSAADLLAGGPVERVRIHLGPQKCASVRFKVEEIEDVADSQGFEANAISMEVGLKHGLLKAPVTKSA